MTEVNDELELQLALAERILGYRTAALKTPKARRIGGWAKTMLDGLESLWRTFLDNDLRLSRYAKSDAHKNHEYFADTVYDIVFTEYNVVKTEFLNIIFPGRNQSTPQSDQAFSNVMMEVPQYKNPLPPITLPTFSGDKKEWPTFKGMFIALVHDVPTIPPILKLQYLAGALKDEAKSHLPVPPLTADKYEGTWATLLDKYDGKKYTLSTYISNLISCPRIKKQSLKELTRVTDNMRVSKQSIDQLSIPPEKIGELWLIHHVSHKLDFDTLLEWERQADQTEDYPTYDSFLKFLERQARVLDAAQCSYEGAFEESSQPAAKSKSSPPKSKSVLSHQAQVTPSCIKCKGEHHLHACPKFKDDTLPHRVEFCKTNRLCLNCLRDGHFMKNCKSPRRCLTCKGKHHTQLHRDSSPKTPDASTKEDKQGTATEEGSEVVGYHGNLGASAISDSCGSTLLATALIQLQDTIGNLRTVRALIDPGSENSFISEKVFASLSPAVHKVNVKVTGIGGTVTSTAKKEATLILKTNLEKVFFYTFSAFVLDKLTQFLPRNKINPSTWAHIKGLTLADPEYYKSAQVGCILGVDVYPSIMLPGLIKGKPTEPVAQQTVFGWILSGNTSVKCCNGHTTVQVFHSYIDQSLDSTLRMFWEIEEIPRAKGLTQEESDCEQHFVDTTTRNEEGRFIVRLPFKQRGIFQRSREIAVACLLRQERRLARHPKLASLYKDYMQEYLRLGHMELVPPEELSHDSYYVPHHSVQRGGSQDAIRMVFNGSQKDSTGMSLNDILVPGPKLQADITAVLIRWKFFKYVFTTDIIKMFRQILVNQADRNWQRVVWRKDTSAPIQDYRLTTVMQGTASAPYLALRVLQQLATEGETSHPEAALLLKSRIYVDDAFGGADDLDSLLRQKKQLIDLLKSAGMDLGKWSANDPQILTGVVDANLPEVILGANDTVSTLGIKWSPSQDNFMIKVSNFSFTQPVTKRLILSCTATLFDPMGWSAPVIIVAKVLLQDLWIEKLDWDQPVKEEIQARWSTIQSSLPGLENIQIPRWIGIQQTEEWHLHGFADASKRVYAAVVYAVIPGKSSSFLMAKTKLTPISAQTIPRLELCSAMLLTKLTEHLTTVLTHQPTQIHFWSDSKVVLDWLKGHPSRWPTFIANRVSQIKTTFPSVMWRHVKSTDNAADCATRGLLPSQLMEHRLWWKGPSWITKHQDQWPATTQAAQGDRKIQVYYVESDLPRQSHPLQYLISHVSDFSKIRRLLAYWVRWRHNAFLPKDKKNKGPFTAQEWNLALVYCFRAIQRVHYLKEIEQLHRDKNVLNKSNIKRYSPFIDDQGLLRIRGRLANSTLPYSEKYPILLPGTEIIIKRYVALVHNYTHHGGPQLMLSYLYRKVWILQAPRIVKQIYRTCLKCARYNAQTSAQVMADLPADRITPERPFSIAGLDYAGPLEVLFSKGRGAKKTKGYVVIFVCFVIKAIHIEIVSDLTTEAFLAAYARFSARRGVASQLYSYNATTFRGAAKELRILFNQTSEFVKTIKGQLAIVGTDWSFIPPRAPHFGGLWEAAVKSFKYHFKRAVGDSTLTYEELSTLAAQVEACLNSRPLCPLSTDPVEPLALTPGHFLTGTSCLAPPEPIDLSQKWNLRHRWTLVTQLRNSFWDRWRKEVLHHMQQRNKWLKTQPNLRIGDLVIIKDELTPPGTWPLGIITATHPGSDELVRTVTVKTASSHFIRPVVKIIKLPREDEVDERYDRQRKLSSRVKH